MSRDILLQHLAALLTVGDIKTQCPARSPGGADALQRLLRTLCVTMIMDADNKAIGRPAGQAMARPIPLLAPVTNTERLMVSLPD